MLGLKVVSHKRASVNLFFGGTCLSVFVWLACTAVGYCVRTDETLAAFWFRLDWAGVSYISVSIYGFASSLVREKRRVVLITGYLIATCIDVLILSRNSLMAGVHKFRWGYFPLHDHRWSPWLLVFFFTYMMLSFDAFIKGYRLSSNSAERNQIKYIFLGFLIGYLASQDYLPTFGVAAYPLGFVWITVFIALCTYAIVKHQLMDINIMIRKTLLYSLLSASLAAIYVGTITFLAYAVQGRRGPASPFFSALAAVCITLLFNPLRRRIQLFIDRHFFREALDQALLREATSGFVHEIKRPLAKISLPAELSLMDLEDLAEGRRSIPEVLPKVQQRLRYILDQTADAGDKIEAIREVSTSDPGQAQDVDLAEVIRRGVAAERSLCERHHVEIKLDLGQEALKIRGHAKQLEIVVTNLIKNSVEAIAAHETPGQRMIRIAAARSDDHVTMTMQDTGPGINPENLPRLFEPYFTTKGAKGTGMGLFLCRQIVQAHGGRIGVGGDEGRSAKFVIVLPSTSGEG